MKNKTIFLGLNEINFELINYYISKGLLPNFKKLLSIQKPILTISEKKYSLLEPWIQWVTIHTGKSFDEHKVFRLGDIVNHKNLLQIFEELESKGLSVGAISPFNCENRLKKPKFFIPDPWTKTNVSGNFIIKSVYDAISQSVNDNAQSKLDLKSFFSLLFTFLIYVPISRWFKYFKFFLRLKRPGVKAIVLDSLLADLHLNLWNKHKPDFSFLFLNSGAHIQHHYLFNSEGYKGNLKNPEWYCPNDYDPLIKILSEYDYQIGKLICLKNVKLLVATGLHQMPHKKLTFYWRLKQHVKFAKTIGIRNIKEILPRMSRDFLITFNNKYDSQKAKILLESFRFSVNNMRVFAVDNRGESLFVELIYANDIQSSDSIYSSQYNIDVQNFKSYISFVAIKNGEHNGTGYLCSNYNLECGDKIPLKYLNKIIKNTALG